MFPIPFNFPFRKKDGTITTMDDAISSGGGGDPYVLPTASASTKGGVKIGAGFTMDGEVLNNSNPTPPTPYVLPTASDETLGGVKIGNGLSIDENGVLSASGGGGGGLSYVDVDLTPSSVTVNAKDWATSQFQAPADIVGKNIVSVVVKDKNSPYLFCIGASTNYDISASTWIMCGFFNTSGSAVTVSSVRIFYQ